MVPIFWHHLLGAMLRKLAIFKARKYVHSTIFCTTSNENLNTRVDMLHITIQHFLSANPRMRGASLPRICWIELTTWSKSSKGAHDFAWGRCCWKCRFSKEENGYARTQFFVVDFLLFNKQKFSTSCFRSKPPFSHQHTRIRNVLLPTTLPFQKIFWD